VNICRYNYNIDPISRGLKELSYYERCPKYDHLSHHHVSFKTKKSYGESNDSKKIKSAHQKGFLNQEYEKIKEIMHSWQSYKFKTLIYYLQNLDDSKIIDAFVDDFYLWRSYNPPVFHELKKTAKSISTKT